MEKQELYKNLSEIFGPDRVSIVDVDLRAYVADDLRMRKLRVFFPELKDAFLPDAVVIATDTEQMVKLVKFANENKIPLVPRAGGSSLHGQLVPVNRGVIVDTTRMDKILEINVRGRYVVVQPGVLFAELNRQLEPYGYTFPTDPGSAEICRIGGMVANNASGVRACKYGVTRDFVLGLEVILPNGQVVRTGGKALKSSSGLDIKNLFIGSEGTLGIITEVILKIIPRPKSEVSMCIGFPTLDDACMAATEILGAGYIPSSMELIGSAAGAALNLLLPEGTKLPAKDDGVDSSLLIRADGNNEAEVRVYLEEMVAKTERFKPAKKVTYDANQAEIIWSTREKSYVSGGRLGRPPPEFFMTGGDVIGDFGVPIDKIPEFVKGCQDIGKKYRLMISYIGHISDGNIHLGFAYRRPDKISAKNEALAEREMAELVVKLGGTISAEHGPGLWMAHLLPIEHKESLDLMRAIKKMIDPNGIMNPGKMALDFIPDIVDPVKWFKEGQ